MRAIPRPLARLPLALGVLLQVVGAREARAAGPVKVRASEAFAPCLEPALAAFTNETGIAAVLAVGEPDPPGDADVVVGDGAELTRLLEGPAIDYTTTIDLGTIPWVLVVPPDSEKADVAALGAADRVLVLGGRVGRDALLAFKGMPTGRSRFSRDRAELAQAPYALVPRSLAGSGEHRAAGVRPLVASASAVRASARPGEARRLLAHLRGRGRPACFDAPAAAVHAQAAGAAAPYASAVVDWWLPDCSLRTNAAAHNDPQQALGAPNAQRLSQDSYTGMFSLGQAGYVTLDMGATVVDGPGADILVFQTTSFEPVSVYAATSAQGPFTLIGFRRDCGFGRFPGVFSGYCEFDLSEGRVTEARYLKIEDGEIYPCLASGTVSEGADVDAVQILNQRP
jgi:hypothetical protein